MAKVSTFIGIILLTSVWLTVTCKTNSTNNPCACGKNNNCETNNGSYCTDGCVDGYWGDTCDKECPGNCATCKRNSSVYKPCTSCIDGYYWSTARCDFACRSRCVSCASYDNCNKCPDGRYGRTCRYSCYKGCEGGVCDIMDGKCTCKAGYTSGFCRASCFNNPCACCKNNKCETNNGNYCTDGCIDGIWGGACDKECPSGCVTCTQGSVDRGRPCTSCLPEKYNGKYWDQTSRTYYDDCRNDCRNDCASCTSFYNCTECNDGRYGKYGDTCEKDCAFGCEGGVCDKVNGKCTNGCIVGYSGDKCCIYNSNCETCSSNTQCSVCKSGYSGSMCCVHNTNCVNCSSYDQCSVCKSGYSGDKCCLNSNNCKICSSNTQCSVCKTGYSGDKCCVNNDGCLTCSSTSECSKCKAGYDINTNCSECVINKYGSNCDSDCHSNCLNNGEQSKCYDHNGTCVVGCQEGFYGDKCELRCHQNCELFNCSRSHGMCLHGCQNEFIIFGSDCVPAPSKDYVKEFPVAIFTGAVGGAVVFVVIIAAVVVKLTKRRTNRQQSCRVTTNDVTQGRDSHVYVNVADNANEMVEVTDIAANSENRDLDEIASNDPKAVKEEVYISTTDGHEVPTQDHCETIDDAYEPLNNQHRKQGNCDKRVVPMYENTKFSN